jgi:hypothetical protein
MLKKNYKRDTFDLAELDLHNGIEHDASLTRTYSFCDAPRIEFIFIFGFQVKTLGLFQINQNRIFPSSKSFWHRLLEVIGMANRSGARISPHSPPRDASILEQPILVSPWTSSMH